MRLYLQRVLEASLSVKHEINAVMSEGLLILVGIEDEDSSEDIEWLCNKIVKMRIFSDENEMMNKSLLDIDGDAIVVSQFTLHANIKKVNRRSYTKAAKPYVTSPLYEKFIERMEGFRGEKVRTSELGADMRV